MVRPRPRTIESACIVWICGGWLFGWHQVYLGDFRDALWHITTLGGFGFGAIVDLFRMPTMVAKANRRTHQERNTSWSDNELPVLWDEEQAMNSTKSHLWGTVICSVSNTIKLLPRVINYLFIVFTLTIICDWYDFLLRKLVIISFSSMASDALCWSVHRTLRPIAIAAAVYYTTHKLNHYTFEFRQSMLKAYALEILRESIYQQSGMQFSHWGCKTTLAFTCALLYSSSRPAPQMSHRLDSKLRGRTLQMIATTLMSIVWFALLSFILVRGTQLPIAIRGDSIHWQRVYQMEFIAQANTGPIPLPTYETSVDYVLPARDLLRSTFTSIHELQSSLVTFWHSIPSAEAPRSYDVQFVEDSDFSED